MLAISSKPKAVALRLVVLMSLFVGLTGSLHVRTVSAAELRQTAIVFSDDFSTDPNTNGLWRIYRSGVDVNVEGSWDSTDRSFYLTRLGGVGIAAFANYPLTATQWEARFKYLAGGGSGADGFTFMFYKNDPYSVAGGGGLGFQCGDCPTGVPGYGIEFDNFYNPEWGDPYTNHIALIEDNTGNHLTYVDDSRTEDNLWHNVLIQFDNGHVIVNVDGGVVLDHGIMAPDYSFSGVGFSASAGYYTNNHVIDDFVLQVTPSDPAQPAHIVSDATIKYLGVEVSGWHMPGFDDSAWQNVIAPSGGLCDPSAVSRIPDSTALPVWGQNPLEYQTIYVRKTFTLMEPAAATIKTLVDDDFDLYVNGSLIRSDWNGWASDFQDSISLQSGVNTIAIKAGDTYGGCQSLAFDVEIEPEEGKVPVIIIPGIGGTKLENDQGELWVGIDKACADVNDHIQSFPLFSPPDSHHLEVLRLNESGTQPYYPADNHYSSVRVGGIVESVNVNCTLKWGPITITNISMSVPIYKDLIINLEREGYQRGIDLFVFGYDWRRDLIETSAQLDTLIDQVRNQGKVNIIAHSMGGLVARNYIMENSRAAKVKNLAILGTPFLGSPDAVEALLFGNNLGNSLVSKDRIKSLAQNWPGVYELLPGQGYLLVYPNGMIQEQDVDKNGDNITSGTLNYSQLHQFYDLNFNDTLIDVAESFRANELGGFDIPGNNNVIIFAGAGNYTHESIRFFNKTVCDWIWWGCRSEEHANWQSGNGDGTVPLHSADLQGNGKNYQDNAKVYYVQAEHMGLINNSHVFDQIMQVFSTGDLIPVNASVSTDASNWTVNGTTVKIFSPVDLHIYDADGNHLGPTEYGGIEYGIPGAQYDIIGHDKMAFVPAGVSYRVELEGTDTGTFDMVIQNISDGSTTGNVLFKDIPVTPSTEAELSLSEQDGYILSVDQDNDGSVDDTITPDAVLDGPVSEDTIPPTSTITIGGVNRNGQAIVNIAADDDPDGSGILEIQYSLDEGYSFSPYSGPFSITIGQVQRVTSQAIDKAGNEEFPLTVAEVVNQPPFLTVPENQNIQYSDLLSFNVSAIDFDDPADSLVFSATDLPGNFSLTNNGDGTGTISGIATVAPGTYTAQITVTDPGGLSDSKAVNIFIMPEDARTTYTGPLMVSTDCATCSTAVVPLRATIQDITALSGNPAYDPDAGNIVNAVVSFVNRDNANQVLCTSDVVLLDTEDPTVGTAACDWIVNIGSSYGVDYTIGTIINGYYNRNHMEDEAVVVVSKPATNFITGGGYFVNQNSGGAYFGDAGLKTNFGLNIKFTQKLTNLQGRVTIIVRQGEHIYQIKSTALSSLAAIPYSPTNSKSGTAELIGKANVIDLTDPLNPITVVGNARLNIKMMDEGAPGNADWIGISLWSSTGQLLFSSNWDGTKTLNQLLDEGNLSVK